MRISSRAVSAGQRVREPADGPPRNAAAARGESRARDLPLDAPAIWAAALFSLFVFVPNRHPRAAIWDDPWLTHDLGAVTDVWARWDSVWFLRIAEHGYGSAKGAASAFYPLYPATVGAARARALRPLRAGRDPRLAGRLVRLVPAAVPDRRGAARRRRRAAGGALPGRLPVRALPAGRLQRVALPLADAGRVHARRAPALPRRGRGHRARAADEADRGRAAAGPRRCSPGGSATGCGRSPRSRSRRCCSRPTRSTSGRPRATRGSSCTRSGSGAGTSRRPGRSAGSGTACARAGPGSSSSRPARTRMSTGHRCRTPTRSAWPCSTSRRSPSSFSSSCSTVIAWRRFGAPYGLFAALSLAIPLSVPSERWPLLSMPRFGLTIFPLFLALAVVRRAAAGAHRDRGRQLAAARSVGRAMGALAVGRMRIALVPAAALLLLAGTACGERSEPTGALVQSYPVTVQGAGDGDGRRGRPEADRPGRRRARVRSCKALGLDRRTVTVDDTLVGLPLVGAIRRAKPGPDRRRGRDRPARPGPGAQRDARAPSTSSPAARSDDVVQAIGDIGLLTGRPVQARRLTARIEAKRQAVAKAVAGTPLVTAFVDTGGFSTISSRSLLGDLIALAARRRASPGRARSRGRSRSSASCSSTPRSTSPPPAAGGRSHSCEHGPA